jgi:hypothetical protein
MSGDWGVESRLKAKGKAVTDGDVFHRHPARAWTAAWKLLAGGHPAPDVAAAVEKALAATVRMTGGIPRCDDFADVVEAVAHHETTVSQAFDRINGLEREAGAAREARLAARATEQLVVEASQDPARLGLDLRGILAQRFLDVMVENQFFGRIRPELQGRQFRDPREAPLFEAPYRGELNLRLSRLAKKLAADPTVAHPERIRASAFRRPQTRQALGEVLA